MTGRAETLIPSYAHAPGCPSGFDPVRAEQRVESYAVDRPSDAGGGTVRVARCIDCGAHVATTSQEADSDA